MDPGSWPSFFIRHWLGEFLIDDQATDQKYEHHTNERPKHIHDNSFCLMMTSPLKE